MDDYRAKITFSNYMVTELHYEQNSNYDFDAEKLDVDFNIKSKVQISQTNAAVSLSIICGRDDNSECPFIIRVSLMGIFEYEGNIKSEEAKSLLTTNAIAILFPYLRSLVSDISGKSNIYPQYKLPLINVVAMLKENDDIEVIDIDE